MPQRVASLARGDWSQSLAAIASLMHNALALAHVYGQAPDAIAFLDKPLTDNEASQRGAQMAQRENNDRNKHISRAAKSGRFSRSVGRLIVFSGLLLSAVGLWIYLFNQSPALLEMGLAIVGMGVLITASARFWDR
jgi:hypothetical protein